MTAPGNQPLTLPAGHAERIRDLLSIAESLLSALQARGQHGTPATLASLDELARLLAGGRDTAQLISDLADAHLELTSLMLAASPR
jgi:hypothetical protein